MLARLILLLAAWMAALAGPAPLPPSAWGGVFCASGEDSGETQACDHSCCCVAAMAIAPGGAEPWRSAAFTLAARPPMFSGDGRAILRPRARGPPFGS